MANMVATFAQLERRLISQRTREALAIKKVAGVRLGRPPTVPKSVVPSHPAPTRAWRHAAGHRRQPEPRSGADRAGRRAVVRRHGARDPRANGLIERGEPLPR
jgi:hypothetical protein